MPRLGVKKRAVEYIDKATGFVLRTETELAFGILLAIPITTTIDYSHEFPGSPPFPFKEGNQSEVIQTAHITISAPQVATQHETATINTRWVIEAIEDKEVETGIFKQCFKVVVYDDTGSKISTVWRSEEIGMLAVMVLLYEISDFPQTELELVSFEPAT